MSLHGVKWITVLILFSNLLNNRKLCLGTMLIKSKYNIIEEDSIRAFGKNCNDRNECDLCCILFSKKCCFLQEDSCIMFYVVIRYYNISPNRDSKKVPHISIKRITIIHNSAAQKNITELSIIVLFPGKWFCSACARYFSMKLRYLAAFRKSYLSTDLACWNHVASRGGIFHKSFRLTVFRNISLGI